MDPASVDTIRQILEDHDVAYFLSSQEFEELVSKLENRENIMIMDRAPDKKA